MYIHTPQALYVLVATGNTVFSYFWDVERDWEIRYFSAPKGTGRGGCCEYPAVNIHCAPVNIHCAL